MDGGVDWGGWICTLCRRLRSKERASGRRHGGSLVGGQQQPVAGSQLVVLMPDTARRATGADPVGASVAGGVQSNSGAAAGSTGSAGASSSKAPV